LRALLDSNRINEATVERMLRWTHSGFHVHRGNELYPQDSEGRRRVARYLLHPPVAVERMEYHREKGVVTYRTRQGRVETLNVSHVCHGRTMPVKPVPTATLSQLDTGSGGVSSQSQTWHLHGSQEYADTVFKPLCAAIPNGLSQEMQSPDEESA